MTPSSAVRRLGGWLKSFWPSRIIAALKRRTSQYFWQSGTREFLWPLLTPRTAADDAKDAANLANDQASISSADFSKEPDAVLEEARRLADAEGERRKGADQKASTYLAVVAALAPLLLAGATAIWEGKAGSAPPTFNMLLLGLALLYLAAAGIWAFRVLEVSPSHRIGTGDVIAAWKKTNPEGELARQIMWAARSNYIDVNRKVSRIKMTHAYLLRAFLTFVILLLFNILFFIAFGEFSKLDHHSGNTQLDSPNKILLADKRIDELNARLLSTPAWRVFAPSCGRGTKQALIGSTLFESRMRRTSKHSSLANAFGYQTVRFRKLRLYCGAELPLTVRVWDRSMQGSSDNRRPHRIDLLLPQVESGAEIRSIRLWPSRPDTERQSFPPVLLRQSIVVRDPTGNVSAIVEVEVDRRALPSPS